MSRWLANGDKNRETLCTRPVCRQLHSQVPDFIATISIAHDATTASSIGDDSNNSRQYVTVYISGSRGGLNNNVVNVHPSRLHQGIALSRGIGRGHASSHTLCRQHRHGYYEPVRHVHKRHSLLTPTDRLVPKIDRR